MTDLQQRIAETRRWLDAIDAAADRGELPAMADAKLLANYAASLEQMVWHAHIDSLRATPERTAAEDKQAQRYVETGK
jgi:hypothetical protein